MIKLNHKWLAIIAGGQGTRLFPYSHPERPKQFCRLNEQDTFIQAVIRNFGSLGGVIPKTQIVVITTNETQTKLAREQTIPRGVLSQNIHQIDPDYDFSGAAVKATELIYTLDPQAVIISTPSDQYVNADEAFCDTIARAVNEAEQDSPTIVGVKVNDLAMAMGCGHAIYDDVNSSPSACFSVKNFVEKPSSEELADRIMRAGNSACNTGITVWQAKHICEDLANRLSVGLDEFARGLKTDRLMERFDNLKIAVGEFDWRDCGTLEGLYSVLKKTPNHLNASLCDSIERRECLGNLFLGDPGYRLYTTGCRDVAVVVTTIDNRPMVAVIKKQESARVKELAENFAENRDLLVNDFSIQANNNFVMRSNMSEESAVCFVGVDRYAVLVHSVNDDVIDVHVSNQNPI